MILDGPAGRWLGIVLAIAASVGLFLLMIVSFVDVLGRQTISAPLPGATELTEILLAWVVFVTLPLTTRADDHIVIDLLDVFVPRWLRPVQRTAIDLVGALAFAMIAWQVWIQGDWIAGYGEHTAVLEFPLAWVIYGIAVFAAVTALAFLLNAVMRWLPARQTSASGG